MDSSPGSTLHPQTRRHLHNTQRLREAAIREFARHGLQGSKVSNIVTAAQLTQPSFYRTWPSKEAAYEEIIVQTIQAWQGAAAQVMAGPPDLALGDRIGEGLEQLYTLLVRDLELTRLVLRETDKNPDRHLPFIAIYTRVFTGMQARGLVTSALPAETLAQTYTAVTERFFLARLYTGQRSARATAREVTALLLPVFRKESPE
ncbi:TetR/AcrR family transcriptional regulator [Deinococcus aestuarii]|uniref:TetR/AcrR family transcriptional regulator n=1 Tax=Deinococcus aestuarii TaxID=2774531 RepID=UPI001C0A9D12|nr:TetR/AcrR family transcriptional regulator [Deinococcus aestuarii]